MVGGSLVKGNRQNGEEDSVDREALYYLQEEVVASIGMCAMRRR